MLKTVQWNVINIIIIVITIIIIIIIIVIISVITIIIIIIIIVIISVITIIINVFTIINIVNFLVIADVDAYYYWPYLSSHHLFQVWIAKCDRFYKVQQNIPQAKMSRIPEYGALCKGRIFGRIRSTDLGCEKQQQYQKQTNQ